MMKKSIFAIAVASALTLGAAQAETVLYGSIRYDYSNQKHNTLVGSHYHVLDDNGVETAETFHRYSFQSKRLSDLNDAGSRIGLKGSEDLGNGNAVIYNIEYGFNGMSANGKGFKTRLAVLGLTGDWGTFTAGRQENPFWQTLVKDSVVDDFNGSSVITSASQRAMTSALLGLSLAEAVHADYDEVTGELVHHHDAGYLQYGVEGNPTINTATAARVGKVAAYTTPDIAGFQANIALMMNADLYKELGYQYTSITAGTNQQKSIDLWTINAQYNYDLGANGSILAKAGYINAKLADNNSSKMWGLYLGYLSDAFNVTASYAQGDHTPQNTSWNQVRSYEKDKYQGWDIGASYSFGANYFSTIRANYGQNTIKNNAYNNYVGARDGNKDKVKSWAVGFEQKLSTRTRAWVEYGSEETSYAQHNIDKKKDSVISVGMRHDF